MRVLRTPDDRFADLPGFPYAPSYATTSDGLRMAYVDEGTGPTVLLLHGEPSWATSTGRWSRSSWTPASGASRRT
jgi:haloalkane dehalogenase